MTAILGTPQHAAETTDGRHPATVDGLLWLCFSHLPAELQRQARPFYQTAVEMILANVDSPELTKALNALTEAKDWAVRAGIRTSTGQAGPVPRPDNVVDRPHFPTHERGLVTGYPTPKAYPTGVEPHSEAGRIVARDGWTRPVRDNPQA